MPVPRLRDRACGILLHPTSLAGVGDSGELGSAARAFADFLAEAGQGFWQMLPVGPTGYGQSPYSALSAFAGNPDLVSRERLVEDGLLYPDEAVRPRQDALRIAFERFEGRKTAAYEKFCAASGEWLEDFALYEALKGKHGGSQWTRWEAEVRDRTPAALVRARKALEQEIAYSKFLQFRFDEDWNALRAHCGMRGIGLIGDLPIFVAHDSADVWQHRELFHLRPDGEPALVAGVPPDYFSITGQRWGNPLYRWKRLAKTGYKWWIDRLRTTLGRFDAVRLDHFIGFVRYWEIPGEEATAVNGRWMKGPGASFFQALERGLGTTELPLIAEDLGAVTPKVTLLRDQFRLPGIKVLQFAFGTDPQAGTFLPHNYSRHSVAFTGTHDNDTTVGWFSDPGAEGGSRTPEQTELERRAVLRYLGLEDQPDARKEIHWHMIRALYASVANLVIVPMQDVLGLGNDKRMNRPGVALGNWGWRLDEGATTPALAERLRRLAETYDRIPAQSTVRAATDLFDAAVDSQRAGEVLS